MAFDPADNFRFVNANIPLLALTEEAALAITRGGPIWETYAIGRRLYEIEQRKASAAILSNAVAGNVAYATISLSTLPLTGSLYEIGSDVYQLKAAAAEVTDDTYIAVATNADKDVVGAALAAAINATNVRNAHRSIFKADGVTAARANGSKNVRAVYVASTDLLWIFAATAPGGTLVQGTAPDLALDATATGSPSWSVANLNLAPGAGQQNMSVWRERVVITSAMISAGTVKFAVPFYSATYYGTVRAYTAANERKGTVKAVTDTLSLAAGPISGTGVVTLTLPGGGSDLLDTEIAYLEIWAPGVETLAVPVSEVRVLDGRLDLLELAVQNGGTLETRVDALESGRSYTYSMTGAGDQVDLSTVGTKTFVAKATVPVIMGVDDYCDWEAEVYVDGADSTPQYTIKMLLGTAELESEIIATAAAGDYVVLRGSGRVVAATTMRMCKGLGETKDGTLALQTREAPTNVTIQALTAARDVTVNIVSTTQHATNLATIKSLRFSVHKRAA